MPILQHSLQGLHRKLPAIPLVIVGLLLAGCSDSDSQKTARNADTASGVRRAITGDRFNNYWYAGKAELNRYQLDQACYGEMHEGEAVLMFEIEDFIVDRQVTLDSEPAGKNTTPVLKLNLTRRFTTGISPYSLMTSVFTPVDGGRYPHTLKVTASAQEWFGQTWRQYNLRGGQYDVTGHSYVEREGEEAFALDAVLLEDEVWTLLRLDPRSLPVGAVTVVPGTMAARLRHRRPTVETATARLSELAADSTHAAALQYSLAYGSDRTLSITIEREFPYAILGWAETYRDGSGPNAPLLTTRATRTSTMMLDDWRHNTNADDSLRTALGLTK